jgi:DEAD/DEAH box helicase domain-containing protein
VANIGAFVEAIASDGDLRPTLKHHEVLPATAAVIGPLPEGFSSLGSLVERRHPLGLYSHQSRALGLIARGSHVVLATPTASGKTLVYNLPVLLAAGADSSRHALYLFPLKALERDQKRRLARDLHDLGPAGEKIDVAIYDGDTPSGQRRKIRENPPRILITTPDMLHAGILANHASWRTFFRGLGIVVLDELHTYRGIFGSHVSQLLRRLDRVTRFHGGRVQFVAASATIANPGDLATTLTGQPFEVIEENGAPREKRQLLLFRPVGSPYSLATRLFRLAVGLGLRTIAFTKTRVITELMHRWVIEAEPELEARISSYRAGFLPAERRKIEGRLFSGDLMGVISTSALELGIDVGGLDVCLLVGYPGSQIATWQRGGRVGRQGEAAIALIAQPDALDQYLVSHPRELIDRNFEHAIADPHNAEIAAAHLPCAAAEVPLRADEPWLASEEARDTLRDLENDGRLLRSEAGSEWFAARRRPHRDVRLRHTGSSYVISSDVSEGESVEIIGTIGSANVFSECHEGAIYLHGGRQFLVTRLDRDELAVRVRPIVSPYYTRAISEKQTEILSRERSRPAGNFRLVQGRVKVTKTVTGFERRRIRGQDLLDTEPLELPPSSFETVAIWIEFPDEIPQALEAARRHVMGGIHASEHAALSLFPLFVLCDRHDVGGISYTRHPQTGRAAIFLYDGFQGGAGLAVSMFDRVEVLLDATCDLIEDCPCEEGCPSCVHSPKCGNGNRPIDKKAAVMALRMLLARDPLPITNDSRIAASELEFPRPIALHEEQPATARIVYFDLETQRSAAEVGGWHNAHLMRLALAVLYDSETGQFETFGEQDVHRLVARLSAAELVIGFNIVGFDYAVLRGYTDADLPALPTFDMLTAIHQRLGYRLALGHLAEETLGVSKGGDGLQSLAWWKEGRVDEIERYCRQDVALLRDLMLHAEQHGYLCFRTKRGDRVRLPAPWRIPDLVEHARARHSEALPLPRGAFPAAGPPGGARDAAVAASKAGPT